MPKGIYPRKKAHKTPDSSNHVSEGPITRLLDETQRIGITLKGRTDIKVMSLRGVMLGTISVSESGVQISTPNTKQIPALVPYALAAQFLSAIAVRS